MPVRTTDVDTVDIAALKPSVKTGVAKEALLQPAGLLDEMVGVKATVKPVSVISTLPPLGIAACGVRVIVMKTLVADLNAPGLLSVMAG